MSTDRPDRIAELFARTRAERRPAIIPFIPAGWPEIDATSEIVRAAIAGGADALELGLPFSDPLADGSTNQHAYDEALAQGVTPATVLNNVRELRGDGVTIPLIIMGYINPMLAYGIDAFIRNAVEVGVDALIIVDMPPNEAGTVEILAREAGLHLIFLVAPTSTDARLRLVADHARGFIYCVSLTGITGARQELSKDLEEFVGRVREYTELPLAVGFGISRREHVEHVGKIADAVVIGSAFVNVVANTPRIERAAAIRHYLEEISGRRNVPIVQTDRSD